MEYRSAIKKYEVMSFAGKWLPLEIITLGERQNIARLSRMCNLVIENE
jgi:hypothetical protein